MIFRVPRFFPHKVYRLVCEGASLKLFVAKSVQGLPWLRKNKLFRLTLASSAFIDGAVGI